MGDDTNVSDALGIGVVRQLGLAMGAPEGRYKMLESRIWPTCSHRGAQPHQSDESVLAMAISTPCWNEHGQTPTTSMGLGTEEGQVPRDLGETNRYLMTELGFSVQRVRIHQGHPVVAKFNVIVKLVEPFAGTAEPTVGPR